MLNDTQIWLERLSSLHRSQMRRAASAEDMQFVHLEILQYLSMCNRYSNTAQALSEYLGQTKGSISQSLKFMEKMDYVERRVDAEDKRFARLFVTKVGKACLRRMQQLSTPQAGDDEQMTTALQKLLHFWQAQNDSKGFGQCKSCRFNRKTESGRFQCGLTGEALSKSEVLLLCKEYAFGEEV